MDLEESVLTTIDNPFNPFTQFDDWYMFDTERGYNTLSYLARIATTSSELSDEINQEITSDAIDEIVQFNISGKHIKVTKDNFDSVIAQHRVA